MKRTFAKSIITVVLLSCIPVLAGEGAAVKLHEHPQRIVTLLPSLGELAADIAGQELSRIVGVSEYTDYPPALKHVESIGPYHRFSVEKVLSLKPDLVLASSDGNSKDQVMRLRELGIPVVVIRTENFAQIEESMIKVAQAMGQEGRGRQMAEQLRTGIQRVRERSLKRSGTPLKVLIQIGDDPLVVAGGNTFLQEALEAIGARNPYARASVHYPRPSLEDVIQQKPDVIIVLSLGQDKRIFEIMARRWSQHPAIPAVKNKRVHLIEDDALLRPTLRLLEGLALLEKRVYP